MPPQRPARRFRHSGTLSPQEWAAIIVAQASRLGYKMTPRQVAEGVGVVFAESSGNASSNPAGNEHIGAWAEEPGMGSEAQRLDAVAATKAALERWKADGESWWPAWGRWEKEQSGTSGTTRYKDYIGVAERALAGGGTGLHRQREREAGRGQPASGSLPGGITGDLMHAGLVAMLVLGGAAMIGMGTTRLFGAGVGSRG